MTIIVKRPCKYCNQLDEPVNMVQDRYTKEYVHESCRPSFDRNGNGRERIPIKRRERSTKYDMVM